MNTETITAVQLMENSWRDFLQQYEGPPISKELETAWKAFFCAGYGAAMSDLAQLVQAMCVHIVGGTEDWLGGESSGN